ncbi:MAG: hypothetical protein AB7U98_01420 [Candidatus Nitrosocosmicus sp.]
MSCSYSAKYFNSELNSYIEYSCNEDSLESKFCIFHDKDYLKQRLPSNVHRVNERMKEIVQKKLKNKEPIVFIGCNLVDLEFHDTCSVGMYFIGVTFYGKVSFDNSIFLKTIDFSNSKFERDGGIICFNFVKFKGKNVLFTGIKTWRTFSFQWAVFDVKSTIDFSGGWYLNGADFSSAQFSALEIKFYHIVFQYLYMMHTTFFNFKNLYFNSAKLVHSKKQINFFKSKFLGKGSIYFSEGMFFGHISFLQAVFDGPILVDFSEMKCRNITNFSEARFSDEVRFINCDFRAPTHFYFTIFENPTKVFFYTHDLSTVSFLNTDITKVLFGPNVIFGRKNKFLTFDERNLEKGLHNEGIQKRYGNINLGSLLALYRNLRENFEYNLRYDEAGKFFIREMEVKRKFSEYRDDSHKFSEKLKISFIKNIHKYFSTDSKTIIVKDFWLKRNLFPIGLYRLTSKYGESLALPTLFISILFGMIFVFWNVMIQSNYYSTICLEDAYKNGYNSWTILERSLYDIIPFFALENSKACFPDYIFKIFGTIFIGLIFVAARRRFERRFRH